jgi:hypothetical protein
MGWRPGVNSFGVFAKLLVATSSAAVGIFVVELALFCLQPRTELEGRAEVARSLGREFDARTRLEVVQALREEGRDAWPTMKPYLMLDDEHEVLLPLGGISESTSVYCNEGGAYAVFETDEHGFRNPIGAHRVGSIEAAIVGDSFGNGACVQTGEDPPSLLSSRGLPTLSLASPGNGPLIELASLVEYAAPLEPRILLWFYFEGNDWNNLSNELGSPLLRRYLNGDFSQELRTKQREVDDRLRELSNTWEAAARAEAQRSVLTRLRPLLTLYHLRSALGWTSPRRDYEPLVDTFCEVIGQAEREVNRWGGQMLFVYLPSWYRYGPRRDLGGLPMRAHVEACLERHDIPLVDFDRVLSSSDDPLSFFSLGVNPHYNEAGYRRLVDAILSELSHRHLWRD